MKQKIPDIKKSLISLPSDTKHQLVHFENNCLTGFCDIAFPEGYDYESDSTGYYYVVFVLSGSMSLTTPLYESELVVEGHMAFISKYWKFSFKVLENSKFLFFAFDLPIIKTNKEMLDYYCSTALKEKYTFNTLPIVEEMNLLVKLIVTQLECGKINDTEICYSWNNIFFVFLVSHYKRDDVTNFMRPILSGTVDFKSFIENNYLEADGKVERLISLSGMSRKTFNQKFQKEYGMTAKTWLTERLKCKLLAMASKDQVAPKDLAAAIRITTARLCQLTRTYFNCTPTELIKLLHENNEHFSSFLKQHK